MSKENKKILTYDQFFKIDECKCGKNPFKYHNTSKNEYTLKCNTPKEEFDTKTKKWIPSKKQPCNFYCVYYGERPVFEEIKNSLIKKAKNTYVNKDKILEENLKLLFQFVFVSNHTSTLDEINILVQNNLKREPRKTFYFPSIGHFMRTSHYESLEEYRDRIFSKKIVDLSCSYKQEQPVCIKKCNVPVKVISKKREKKTITSNFIVVSDDENSSGEDEKESDRGSETSRELSDYETEEEVFNEDEETEEVFEEEIFDDYDDAGAEFYGDYD
jgi:hypothetical protein